MSKCDKSQKLKSFLCLLYISSFYCLASNKCTNECTVFLNSSQTCRAADLKKSNLFFYDNLLNYKTSELSLLYCFLLLRYTMFVSNIKEVSRNSAGMYLITQMSKCKACCRCLIAFDSCTLLTEKGLVLFVLSPCEQAYAIFLMFCLYIILTWQYYNNFTVFC